MSQCFHKRCVTALRVARACISRLREMPMHKHCDELDERLDSTRRAQKSRTFRRDTRASAAAPQSAAAPSPAFGLTHDSCPNGAPTAQSEFYRVPPNSSALLVTFRAPAKSYSPAGARPGTRPQTRRRGEGDKSIKRPSYPKRHTGLALGLP